MTEDTCTVFKKYLSEYEKSTGMRMTKEQCQVLRKFFDFGVHFIINRAASVSVQTPALFLPKKG